VNSVAEKCQLEEGSFCSRKKKYSEMGRTDQFFSCVVAVISKLSEAFCHKKIINDDDEKSMNLWSIN
jgi:hypothetical protein